MPDSEAWSIRTAAWPQDEDIARSLLRNYAAHLAGTADGAANICIAGFEDELARIATAWSQPNGALLLAFVNGRPAGCVAVRIRPDREATCEMKRLWVEPEARGHSLGRRLAQAAIDWSRGWGADTLLLDTVPGAMPQAAALYRSLGFSETERHNNNPVAGLQFMQLRLR